MIHYHKGRALDPGREVWVYRNLLRAGVWYSVMQRPAGARRPLVVAHANEVLLADVRFVVAPFCRARRAVGRWVDVFGMLRGALLQAERVRYNVRAGTFVLTDGTAVTRAEMVYLGPDGVWALSPS